MRLCDGVERTLQLRRECRGADLVADDFLQAVSVVTNSARQTLTNICTVSPVALLCARLMSVLKNLAHFCTDCAPSSLLMLIGPDCWLVPD